MSLISGGCEHIIVPGVQLKNKRLFNYCSDLPLSEATRAGLEEAGYKKPTDIQRESLGEFYFLEKYTKTKIFAKIWKMLLFYKLFPPFFCNIPI